MFSKVFHNKVIRTIVAVEFFFAGAYGMFSPVFAIFAAGVITGGSVKVAGFAMAIFWITKAVFQLPIARFLDKTRGEKDDFYIYLSGQIIFAAGMFLYIFAGTPTHVYLIQAFLGIGYALNTPAFYGMFSRHLDKHYESFEWSIYSVFSYSIAVAIAGAGSGLLVDAYGFDTLFAIAGAFFILSTIISIIFLRPSISGRSQRPSKAMPGVMRGDHE